MIKGRRIETPATRKYKKRARDRRAARAQTFAYRIPTSWMQKAISNGPPSTGSVGFLLWFLAGFTEGKRGPVVITGPLREEYGLNRKTVAACLNRLEELGLIRSEFRNSNVREITLVVPRKKKETA